MPSTTGSLSGTRGKNTHWKLWDRTVERWGIRWVRSLDKSFQLKIGIMIMWRMTTGPSPIMAAGGMVNRTQGKLKLREHQLLPFDCFVHYSNLNGRYHNRETVDTMCWFGFDNKHQGMKHSLMMIREIIKYWKGKEKMVHSLASKWNQNIIPNGKTSDTPNTCSSFC